MLLRALALSLVLTFIGAVALAGDEREVVVTAPPYSAVPDDGADDTSAFARALDALAEDGALIVPTGTFDLDMRAGLRIETPGVKLIIRGTLVAHTHGAESEECLPLFHVLAPRVRFIGRGGQIRGDGATFHGGKNPKIHRVIYYPPLIYFDGGAHEGAVTSLRLSDPPGGHVYFIGVEHARLTDCVIEGGTEKLTDDAGRILDGNERHPVSRYFGVFYVSTNGLVIQGNHFRPRAGRMQYQWICSSGSGRHLSTSIVGNVFEGAWDHPIYCSGIEKSVVANNTTRRTTGSAIKLIGTDLVVSGNAVYEARAGGIETRNGSRCVVANNIVEDFGHVGIEISPYGGGGGPDYVENVIQGNIIIGSADPERPKPMAAIRILSRGTVSRCKVVNNTCRNTGLNNPALDMVNRPGSPAINIDGGKPGDGVIVTGNTITDAHAAGLRLRNVNRSIVAQNIIQSAGEPIVQEQCHGNLVTGNLTEPTEEE